MDLTRTRLTTMLLAFGLIAGAVVGAFLYYAFPAYYPSWYLGIVFYFLILEILIINIVYTYSKKISSKQLVNLYLSAKVVKLLTSLIFVTIYALVVGENIKSFVLVFVAFYALYLFIETFMFSKIEKQLKRQK